jgi:uncharacterized protein (TIGR02453 family)
MPAQNPFSPALFQFLTDLRENNNRDWFQANQQRYEDAVREPAFQFISDFGPELRKISPHFLAIPKKVGGSLFRIFRDVRFSKDKSPYKTQTGIHFRHEAAKDAHAPGYYLHLAPDHCFMGAGIWHPDGPTLRQIREAIAADPSGWQKARDATAKKGGLRLAGEALKRPPKGFDADHPLIEDLKRKDFIATTDLTVEQVLATDFPAHFTQLCKAATPLSRFLCGALGVAF